MIEDQKYAIKEVLDLVDEQRVETVIIAGDIYDQSVPSSEAMAVFDDFLTSLRNRDIITIIIAGNHDSVERLSFASRLMTKSDIFISQPFKGGVERVVLEDEYGKINFYLLPFLKPIYIKAWCSNIGIDDFQKAMDFVLKDIKLDKNERNVIVSHQFIIGALRSESEELYLGGSEAISIDTYEGFDYVALGHIHKKQAFKDGMVRYPGSLLKYSKSESNYKKSLTIVDMKEKGDVQVIEKPIRYLRDMRIVEGYFEDIMAQAKNDNKKDDYIHINLFDKDQVFDAQARLREVYPNLMSLTYTNMRQLLEIERLEEELRTDKDPFELFNEFYENRKNKKLDDEKRKIVKEIIDEVWGDL